MKERSAAYLALIILLAILGGFFIYPKSFGAKFLPWRLGLDLVGGSHLVYQVDMSNVAQADRDSVLNGIRDVIERRVNAFGVSEPQVFIASSGNTPQLIVELAGVKNVSDAVQQIGQTPSLDFRLLEQNGSSTVLVPTGLTGRYVTGAQLQFNNLNQPQVSLSFNDQGASLFEQITGANINKQLCIILDNNITDPNTDCPVIQSKISGGQAVISGKFTIDQANQLIQRFNAGALPAPITLVNQQTISPNLGANSLNKALVAGLIGTLLVILFMIGYYRKLGLFAAAALVIYIILTLSVFKLIPITLSLAGLAGFILTIGMAVDANVLVFERVKEELKKGISRSAAISEGFKHAWPSIRDSNTSTIITAIILYYFTSSFIRGFALTLLIGVLMSMFSAITTTRLLLRSFLKDEPKSKS